MTKTDTSREAGLTGLEQIANDEARHSHRELIQRLTERAERAEVGLKWHPRETAPKDGRWFLALVLGDFAPGKPFLPQCLRWGGGGWEQVDKFQTVSEINFDVWRDLDTPPTTLAQLDAEPAGVSEPAGVKVTPGKLERIVWSAMVWARENPGPDEVPEYTDGGNSFAETECRATVARILAALEPGQTNREVWDQCKEAVDVDLIEQCIRDTLDEGGTVRDGAEHVAAAIRAMPYPGDSQ